jgi:hypothetical protein
MRFSPISTLALATLASALPTLVKKQASTDIDVDILQFALTVSCTLCPSLEFSNAVQLEHLENAFYKGALSKWTQDEFVAAGFNASLYNELKFIAHDEEGHVTFLEAGRSN